MKKVLLLLLVSISLISSAQTVTIVNKKFVIDGNASCPIYFNGANTPWDNWNDFGGSYDAGFWSSHFATLKANGINSSRVWISCNGDVQPNINTDGTVTGASAQFWANLDDFFLSAQNNGIYIMATMMSFDHTKNTYQKYQSWRNMMNDPAKIKTYCDNYLVPFVNRYKTNPYLMSIDISNEIEWVAEDNSNMKCSYAVLQRFVAMCASAIHNNPRTNGTSVLVTMGSAATKWNGTKMRAGQNGAWSQNNSDGNKWSDAALKAQYNEANAVLDFYSPHYYAWVDEWYSNPYVRTPADFGFDEKAVLIGETPAGNPGTPNLSVLASYEALKNNGYQGHFPWTSNGVDSHGDIGKFGADAKTFATTYSALVKPGCSVVCATVAPAVTTPVVYCKDAAAIALTATGTALKWYADNVTTTALPGAPIPSTATTGTTNYYVSQTLNSCEGPRALIAVTVNALPIATITATTPTTFCTGGNVVLTASPGTGNTYKWFRGTTQVGTAASTYSATESGSYTVEVTNANTTCKAVSAATTVTVNALPIATITTTTPTTFCAGGNVVLTASAATGNTYKWFRGGTTQVGTTAATYTATESGSYTVEVTNTTTTCKAVSVGTTVTVNALPAATITATTPTTFCAGGSVVLTASAGAGNTYKWFRGTTTPVGTTAATYTATESGSYTVEVTGTNTCKAVSSATTVTVNALPTATITATTPTTFCTGGNVVLTASVVSGNTYKWFRGGTTQVGTTASTYTATESGSYTVEVTGTNTCKAVSAGTTVTVNALPTATITTTTPTTFCAGGNVVLTASAATGNTYKWFRGTTQVGTTAATYTATESGSYTVEVTGTNTCKAVSAATTVTVNALPAVAILTTTPTTFCTGGSVMLVAGAGIDNTFKWFRGTVPVGVESSYTAKESGSYTVEVTNTNTTCKAVSAAKVVTVSSGPTWYEDKDGDGAGDLNVTKIACTQPAGFVPNAGDLCPADANKTKPGDCGCGNAETDTDSDGDADCIDTDDDNDGISDANDCAPLNASVGAGATWYEDKDGDGVGDLGVTKVACTQPVGYVPNAGDLCPADANKTKPGDCGCGKAEGACKDCAGVLNGEAALDVCNICSGGTTGIIPKANISECIATSVHNSLSTGLTVYPNPYENDIHVEVTEGEFTVVLYNTSGLEVLRGTYTKSADLGANLSQGIYMMRIEQNGNTATQKVIKK